MLAANSVEGRSAPYLERIENLLTELDSMRGKYMSECKAVREDIKEIYTEARDNGVPSKALKGLVKYRQLERKQKAIADGLDGDEQAAYENLVEALGELGAAAARAAGFTAPETANGSGERADESQLAEVGRGKKKKGKGFAEAGDAHLAEQIKAGEAATTS